MESNGIRLIIKAPNQNVDDQVIECDLSWTIEDLKKYLSEVYPNRPAPREQKIIYSGRLLRDHLQLKDILRHEDKRSSTHTFHLVCSRQSRSVSPNVTVSSSQVTSSSQSSDSYSEESDNQESPEVQQRISRNYGSINSTPTPDSAPSNSVPDAQSSVQNPDFYTQMLNAQQLYANVIVQQSQSPAMWFAQQQQQPTPVSSDMAAYQQMYSNYYYQYMQNMQMLPNVLHSGQSYPNEVSHVQAPPAAVQNPPNRNIRMNAQGGPVLDDDDEHGNRDWLDYFYLCCRGFVLFSIVYFYSSPERLMLVIGLVFLALLYQEGWILARARNNNRRLATRPNQARQRVQANEDQNNSEVAPTVNQNEERNDRNQQNVNEIEAAMDGDDPPHVQNPNISANQNPAWTFITSFFSSLIPEPPAPVNIN